MTVYYPDISAFQGGIGLGGAPAVCLKVTEGTGWPSSNDWYTAAAGRAQHASAFPFAYHFLHAGSAAQQAAHCHNRAGKAGLMLDFEPTGSSRPGLADACQFVDAYRRAGGVCNLVYLPRWYWQQIGSPSLGVLAQRGLHLVSSNYTSYSDSDAGAGWHPYGGLKPAIWQYTDRHGFNGQSVDFNAYRGTLAQLKALVGGTAPVDHPSPPKPAPGGGKAPAFPYAADHYLGQPSKDPHCHSGYYGGPDTTHVHDWQHQMVTRGWHLAQDGQFGTGSESVARLFQGEKSLGVDGKVGPKTWAAAWTAPL